MKTRATKTVVLIVAHPDDETLWVGGTILENPEWDCFVVCLCRKHDADRSSKFYKILDLLNVEGVMGDLDDGPDQVSLDDSIVGQAILDLLPAKSYDLVITHSPFGEYTRHRRHEETGNAVIRLWSAELLVTKALWFFAYEDGDGRYLPKAIKHGVRYECLSDEVWAEKYKLMTTHYGFGADSWEALTTPRAEAFWQFGRPSEAVDWQKHKERQEDL